MVSTLEASNGDIGFSDIFSPKVLFASHPEISRLLRAFRSSSWK